MGGCIEIYSILLLFRDSYLSSVNQEEIDDLRQVTTKHSHLKSFVKNNVIISSIDDQNELGMIRSPEDQKIRDLGMLNT